MSHVTLKMDEGGGTILPKKNENGSHDKAVETLVEGLVFRHTHPDEDKKPTPIVNHYGGHPIAHKENVDGLPITMDCV